MCLCECSLSLCAQLKRFLFLEGPSNVVETELGETVGRRRGWLVVLVCCVCR